MGKLTFIFMLMFCLQGWGVSGIAKVGDAGGSAAVAALEALGPVPALSVPGNAIEPAIDEGSYACATAAMKAQTYCLSSSPALATGMVGLNVILSMVGPAKSTNKSCEQYSKALGIAEKALTAYNTACAFVQSQCDTACGALKTKVAAGEASLAKAKAIAGSTASTSPEAAKEALAISKDEAKLIETDAKLNVVIKQCQGYKLNMVAAGMGLKNVVTQIAKSSSCENKTTVVDCAKDPYNASCAKAKDCSKQENFQDTYCICQRSPNMPSCPGYSGVNINTQAYGGEGPSGNTAAATPAMPGIEGSNSIPVVSAKGGSGSSGSGGSGGSLSGLGGGSGGSGGMAGGKAGGADAKKDKGLNPNILGGYDGGGGGGGGSFSAGRGTASENSAYKAYLPGAAKDPSASASAYANQVTASGSKSNWEKIREMYVEKQTTLVGK